MEILLLSVNVEVKKSRLWPFPDSFQADPSVSNLDIYSMGYTMTTYLTVFLLSLVAGIGYL